MNNTPELVIGLKDRTNPGSLINMLSPKLQECLEKVPDGLFLLGERELRKQANPQMVHERLRVSFWNEYMMATQAKRKMIMQNFIRGACDETYFYKHIIRDPERLAYIFIQPPEHRTSLEVLFNLNLEQIHDIITQPHVNPKTGEVYSKLCDVKFRIFEMLANRVLGSVPHKLETKNLNLNIETPDISGPQTMEEIDQQLLELEGRFRPHKKLVGPSV